MKLDSKNILWGAVILIATVFGLWAVWNLTTAPAGSDQAMVDLNVSETDNIIGAENALVTIVEYSDLQCPACRAFAPLVKQMLEDNPDTVRLVYRHFPLAQHQYAQVAAYAAEAAGNQGKFFEYHDILFDAQDEWSVAEDVKPLFIEYASDLELDVDQFTADMDSAEVKAKVDADLASGVAAGVNSTPSFYVNGEKIRNPSSAESFQQIIDDAVQKAGGTVEDTTDQESSPEGSMDSENGDTMEGEATENTEEVAE